MIFFQLIFIVALFYLGYRRGLIYLHLAQQDEYSSQRLGKWLIDHRAVDLKVSIFCFIALLLSHQTDFPDSLLLIISVGYLWLIASLGPDPRIQAKLKLNFTERAKKIWYLYLLFLAAIALILVGLCVTASCLWWTTILLAQVLPFILMLSIEVLQPFERRLQNFYFQDAKNKILDSGAIVIGVTGSYGKTSVKNALAEVLQVCHASTFWPPAGVNTQMGIARQVREKLNKSYRYAVIEMAAYRLGSIQKLCELAPPRVGIITAIGKQHLERFGSQDVIYQAKTELARAVPEDGILVVNADDVLANRAGLEFKRKENIFYGLQDQPHLNFRAINLKFDFSGSSFEIVYGANRQQVKTKLLGKAAVNNLTGVFAAAVSLGVRPDLVAAHFANLQPVNNRLALEKVGLEDGPVYYLHDGYNSNEHGFVLALDVMKDLPAVRRIIMTPGVIELGTEEFAINKSLAEQAAQVCNYVIVVGPVNKAAFQAGVPKEKLILADSREEAFKKLSELIVPESLILIENDLSDYHEAKYTF